MEKNCRICGEETTPVKIEGVDYYSTTCMDCYIEHSKGIGVKNE